jgi:hypothetical protein
MTTAWELAVSSQDMPIVALTGLKLAELVLGSGKPLLAMRLLGASDAVRGTPDLSDPDAAAIIAAARAEAGEAAERELLTGRAMARPDALALLAEHVCARN